MTAPEDSTTDVAELRHGDVFVWANRRVTVDSVQRGRGRNALQVICHEDDGRPHRLGYDRGERVFTVRV